MSEKLTDELFDLIAADGMRNAAGGIYATCVYEFARAVARAALEQAKQLALAEPRVFEPEAPDPQHRIAAKIQKLIDEVK